MTYKSLLELSAATPVPALLHDQVLAEFRALEPDALPGITPDTAPADAEEASTR